ncbi:hypothetical protein NTHI1209_00718 [Haemophilus influenzae]|uniref:Uncharacterized protein n=1 Tax=Haemophilus influenzae TaxID=727 RepID=A0A158SW71_HAEIF|nr:hypothetical protein NTHI1209_00718 [Haemophilus influenzae]
MRTTGGILVGKFYFSKTSEIFRWDVKSLCYNSQVFNLVKRFTYEKMVVDYRRRVDYFSLRN